MWLRILSIVCFLPLICSESMSEELLLTKTISGHQLAQFRFHIESESLQLGPDYSMFPRIMGEIVNKYAIRELSLSLTQGVWRSEEYGIPPQPSSTTGAILSAWLRGKDDEIDTKWASLVNSLNGIFCTSLIQMVPDLTYTPIKAHPLRAPSSSLKDLHVRAAALGRESVCTENLTPWRKLLPCKQNGLVNLLNPSRLYAAPFHSMSLHLFPICEGVGCTERFRLELNINVLFDLPLPSRSLDWSLDSLFGRNLVGSCNVVMNSTIIVENEKDQELDAIPATIATYNTGKSFSIFNSRDLLNGKPSGNLHVNYKNPMDMRRMKRKSDVSVSSTIGGYDQFSGRLISQITNNGPAEKDALYVQTIPWWMKVFYHSLRMRCLLKSNKVILPITVSRNWQPAISRSSPANLEWEFKLPKESQCTVEIQFEKAFLRMVEFPPDANHGLYVAGAQLTVHDVTNQYPGNSTRSALEQLQSKYDLKQTVTLHSNVLLIPMPVPDFSMPFNVICFVATAVSLCFGPVHSFSTKMLIPVGVKLPTRPAALRLLRFVLIVLLILASYAQYHEMSVNDIKRSIEKQLDKLNNLNM